ncbi:MAG: DUF2157 domain-containing protein [Bacteroidetes bacterium]|nr:DUF2157 domain-containing protein [Bacteroidota bacterium]MCW5894905.1 DUF2157 domain-containing protein [Bacteroidota bacterium]
MNSETLNSLHSGGLITDAQKAFLSRIHDKSLFSLYYELRSMLYLGVLLFTAGLGVIIYQNIDTIGHQAIIGALTLLMIVCFGYAAKRKPPYSNGEVESPGSLYEYVLLLGCLLFAIIVGYIQFQYEIFGTRWQLSALLPAVAFLVLAYSFDHRGVLSLGIAGLASWLGLTVSPVELMKEGIFRSEGLIYTGLLFGIVVCAAALLLDRAGIKRHFTFTSLALGSNILFIACLAAVFTLHPSIVYFLLLALFCTAGILYARKEQSFLFLLLSCVYGYIGLTYMLSDFLHQAFSLFFYFVVSCGAVIYFIFHYKKFLARR